jgi:hypothetical protein
MRRVRRRRHRARDAHIDDDHVVAVDERRFDLTTSPEDPPSTTVAAP